MLIARRVPLSGGSQRVAASSMVGVSVDARFGTLAEHLHCDQSSCSTLYARRSESVRFDFLPGMQHPLGTGTALPAFDFVQVRCAVRVLESQTAS